jgi:hypothetical protein
MCLAQSSVLDRETLQLSLLAARLCRAVESEDLTDFPSASIYRDYPYAALFYEYENYCFLVPDTTERGDLNDWWTNIDPTTARVCPNDGIGECCTGRAGFVRSYVNTDYKNELEQQISDCLNSGEKELVITGHSAGGATATVAHVVWSQANPIVITFGQTASLVGNCSVINTDRYYRFANTIVNENSNLDYDPVVGVTLTVGAAQVGDLFLMGDDQDNVVRFSSGTAPSFMNWGFDVDSHYLFKYIDRLESYQDKDLGTDGWAAGFYCNVDEECKSGKCEGWTWYWSSGKCT